MLNRTSHIFFNLALLTLFSCIHATPIRIIQGIENQTVHTIEVDSTIHNPVSLHFLLTTIGRSTIIRMLESMQPQLEPQDYLTIIFDAKDKDTMFPVVQERTKTFPCTVNVIMLEKNLGFWGHGIRNTYKELAGDFVMHCDDDNEYLPGAIAMVRAICTQKDALYLFKRIVRSEKKADMILWSRPAIARFQIDTGCGVIPTTYNTRGYWQHCYLGDLCFYLSLSKKIEDHKIFFVDYPTYIYY